MSKIQIYIHGENTRDPKLADIEESALIKDIIDAYLADFPGAGKPEEIEVFIEDEEQHRDRSETIIITGIKKKSHIHCHRCKKIDTSIFYNGEDKLFHFSPSATIKKIFKKAIEAFGISESDAGDYLLKLEDNTVLQPAEHIGSFVSYPRCSIKLYLTAKKPVQG